MGDDGPRSDDAATAAERGAIGRREHAPGLDGPGVGYVVPMQALRRHNRFTLDAYLEFELHHQERFEYVDGEILAMAGASPEHNIVAGNTFAALHARLRGRCRSMGSDQRVATGDGLYTYPDAVVVCGTMQVHRYKGTATLLNPTLLLEVLSPSTRDYDLGEKLDRYQTIPTLQHVLLIEAEGVDVRHVHRTPEGWVTQQFQSLEDRIDLLGVTLPLVDIYVDVAGP